MFDAFAFNSELGQIGYRRLKSHVYKAEWGKDVEHYIYTELYGTPKIYFAADFGFRTPGSQAFAVRCIDAYGPEIHRMMRHRQDPANSYMRFSLGQLGSWGSPDSLDSTIMSGQELATKVRQDIEDKLFPIIRSVTSLDRLLALLLVDAEPCRWFRCNGAMRAAMIAYLGRRLGASSEEIRTLLNPHIKEIALQLVRARNEDPAVFIEQIIADSAAGVGGGTG